MSIGIIVYSQTGNTLKVCEAVKTGLESEGFKITIERIEGEGHPGQKTSEITLTNEPDARKYDSLIFASPVQAFSLAVPMQKYMEGLSGLNGKKAAFIMTKGLPFKWTGATHALSQMHSLADKAGAAISRIDTVIWPSRNPERDTAAAIARLKEFFR